MYKNMLIFDKISELRLYLEVHRKRGQTFGFVPTMGALHQGHISLIKRSETENDLTICSIFVNPTQFNDKNDLEKYPKTLGADKVLLENAGCNLIFVPEVQEIYPEMEIYSENVPKQTSKVKLGNLDKVMEGAQRPGHFEGVVQVVSRLFDIVEPEKAYFGQKDFQQQAIVREMGRQLYPRVTIVTCPIVREPDGLAMSSRNVRLSPLERRLAVVISQTLFAVQKLADELGVDELTLLARNEISKVSQMKLEYFQIVDGKTLKPVSKLERAENVVACIAVRLGEIRLIDNVILRGAKGPVA
jgi:pantoate--beta-alanine ligase